MEENNMEVGKGKFSLGQINNDDEEVIRFGLKNAKERKLTYKQRKRGGNNESPANQKAILAGIELLITKANRMESRMDKLERLKSKI